MDVSGGCGGPGDGWGVTCSRRARMLLGSWRGGCQCGESLRGVGDSGGETYTPFSSSRLLRF